MSLDAEDSSPLPDPGLDQDSEIMDHEKIETESTDEKSPTASGNGDIHVTPAKPNAKDPSRPRRKKARRACHACQRAHLTCGDERPCNRCVKRNIAGSCQDGVRKKAKYLHDAPPEALNIRTVPNGNQNAMSVTRASPNGHHGIPVSQSQNYFPVTTSTGYTQYPVAQQQSMRPPALETNNLGSEYSNNQSMDGSHRYSISSQHLTPNREVANSLDQPSIVANTGNQPYTQNYLDSTTPDLYDMSFDVSGLNFGSTYAHQEFSMLGQMSSGTNDMSNMDALNSMGQHNHNLGFDRQYGSAFGYPQIHPNAWHMPGIGSRTNSERNIWATQNPALDAFAIGEHPPSLSNSSPKSPQPDITGYPSSSPKTPLQPLEQSKHQQQDLFRMSVHQPVKTPFPGDPFSDPSHKRKRNTSTIYASVTKPYPYTAGFHAMTDFLTKKFPRKKVLKIAKALATIRPSFIACNKNLTDDDLTFTERAFQRALWEYKEMMTQTSTPTIICRRTGEVAAVSKEFTLMTDWRKDVLLGDAPNLNVNSGSSSSSGSETGTSSRGAVTPRNANVDADPNHKQPVFLAELMDEESVVEFYEQFAEIAFGASRSSVVGEPCTLLKYRTKDDPLFGPNDQLTDDGLRVRHSGNGKQETHLKTESGMRTLGGGHGKIECSLCWTVKRDTFDMPLLIVLNFLPVIGN